MNVSIADREACLKALAGSRISVVMSDPRAPADGLLPSENRDTARMVEARQREFAAGRRAARAAMAPFGYASTPIPQGADRAPIWPDGLVGSISHTKKACVAALALRSDYRSIGIDIEEDSPLEKALWPVICTETERTWLRSQPEAQQGHLAKIIFSAKEAVYKCQYPISQAVFGFDRVDIALNAKDFSARFRTDIPPFRTGTRLSGRYDLADGLIMTLLHLEA
ncbi:4'-phosphopantetheinyl transferase [Thalassococcus sp. S3]|uniref:4'-phosphopantetheinyl transferase family protein n=1 Tax=Thalassococcus sp. S3 TaxID=2017482 RepID=UPI0010246C27|nr:4'-phosphopantetheinyl transferase superfamily protein [Thalassococcus sp. S3]QBF31987.1 phosphopantetheinyl transferase [Thalassococcus sp. S3]